MINDYLISIEQLLHINQNNFHHHHIKYSEILFTFVWEIQISNLLRFSTEASYEFIPRFNRNIFLLLSFTFKTGTKNK